ncbi:hypothetical protein B0H34DRAFT_659542 [Crassisporium funariophilum]|nr:hypothetical protein B0H34DRAFT_659542 [Crassisporium funariophilum]
MATELYVIIDDNGGQFQYAGGEWTLSTLEQWFGATSWYPGFAVDGTEFGSFTFTFEGTSVAFIGNTPDSQAVLFQTATVSIDGGTPYNITYGDVPPPAYRQWYQSPTLADGPHTIRMGHLAMTAVDFALVRVGSQTPLSGKRVFVDNDNAAFKYDGTWSRETGQFNAGSLPDGFPVGNSTHRTSTPGSTMTFRFSGTAASIYGIFDWANIGRLAATYTLDGVTDAQNYVVTAATPQHLNNDGQASNFLLFSYDSLPSGDHTLVINVTNCVSQTFMLDYITYSPSFSSLAAMPNLTATVTPPSSSSLPNPSTSPSSTAPSTSQVSQNEISKKAPVGVIVGGVVGGLVLLALLAFLLIWIRKRRRAKSAQETVQSFPRKSKIIQSI